MSVNPRDLLFYAGGECLQRFGTLVWRPRLSHDLVPTFTRSGSVGPFIGSDGVLRQASANRPRIEWVDLDGDGVRETPGLLLEQARTNALLNSGDTEATGWAGGTGWTKASATSIINGGTARQYTNDGVTSSNNRYQQLSTLGSDSLVASMIVENVDATESRVGIYDQTAASFVARADYVWSTGAVTLHSVAGTDAGVRVETLAESGPNGGKVVRLTAYGVPSNSGNTERVYIYPSGASINSEAAIIHHVQREVGVVASSPIVTSGTSATRNTESVSAPLTATPQAMTVYAHFIESGTRLEAVQAANARYYVHIGGTGDPNCRLVASASGLLEWSHDNGPDFVTATFSSGLPDVGDEVEWVGQLFDDGSVRGHLSVNGGAVASTAQSSATALKSTWSDAKVYIGLRPSTTPGLGNFLSVKIAAGTKTMAEMRNVFPRAAS